MLELSHRQWEATTRLLTGYGNVYQEYERGYDQFHQAESYIYFYFLCLADPANPLLVQRAQRFAGLYLNEDPEAPNYDPVHKIIRSPHNGSGGPIAVWDEGTSYGYSPGMARYGLPFEDVPGARTIEDLKDPELARRMGETMRQRMSWGDVPANLGATTLATNAYLLTGDQKYVRWVAEYVDAWVERARRNGGLLPDNVGLSGQMGETMSGKWYGGHYGWTWPHGFYNIGMTACVAATNAFLLTGEAGYLDLPRAQMDGVMARAEERDVSVLQMSLGEGWDACGWCPTATPIRDGSTISPCRRSTLWRCGTSPWMRPTGGASSLYVKRAATTGAWCCPSAPRRRAATRRRGSASSRAKTHVIPRRSSPPAMP
jgi:hypothetical protein